MKLVVIESPYSGDVNKNREYALRCMSDSLKRGEAPIASHLLLTQVLNDEIPEERVQGIEAGVAWSRVANVVAVYTDLGISIGMRYGIDTARVHGATIEYRSIF